MSEPIQPLLLRVPQVAELLNVSERHVRSMVSSGELPVVRMGVAIRISRRAVEQYIADQEQQAPVVHPSIERLY